jgi:hypothetical protein
LDCVDEDVEVVERRAQVDERGVAAAQRRGQELEVGRQRRVLVGDRAGGGVGVADQRGKVVAARGDVRDELRGVDDEVGRAWLSDVTCWTSSSVVEMKGLKYLALWLACLPLPTYCSPTPG